MQVFHTESGIVLAQIINRRTDGPQLAELIREQFKNYQNGQKVTPIFPLAAHENLHEVAAELATPSIRDCELLKNTALLIRTSGSTSGQGKIVLLSFGNLLSSATATTDFFHTDGAWINLLPLHHIAGFQTVFRSILAKRKPIFLSNISEFLEFCEENFESSGENFSRAGNNSANIEISQNYFCSLVPAQLAQILEILEAQPENFPQNHNLKTVQYLIGGAAISPDLHNRARKNGLNLTLTYGMTETSGGCVYNGFPIGDTQISLSFQGQISLQGSSVALGYYGIADDDAFTRPISEPNIHHTRDFGTINAGTLSVLGRIDDAINSGGATIIPQLLETALKANFGLEWHVVGTSAKNWGEVVTAVVKAPPETLIPSLRQIQESLREKFEPTWLPRRLVKLSEIADDWPETDSGKFNRRMLRTIIEKNQM
ncbi:MAG: AMP-binding protein [Arcanobacterium sp.]|nr:AMP-binding protein [Arcanobacterium sp.]